jgi:hypothetical protein
MDGMCVVEEEVLGGMGNADVVIVSSSSMNINRVGNFSPEFRSLKPSLPIGEEDLAITDDEDDADVNDWRRFTNTSSRSIIMVAGNVAAVVEDGAVAARPREPDKNCEEEVKPGMGGDSNPD